MRKPETDHDCYWVTYLKMSHCGFLCLSLECRFLCTNGRCLNLGSQVCDQLNHCGDNSDEEHCPISTQHPASAIFSCESICNIVALDSDLPVFWWSQNHVFMLLIGQFSSEFLRCLYPSHLQSVRRVLSGVSAHWNVERDCVCVCVCKWFVCNIGCGHIAKISLKKYIFQPFQ